MPIVFPHDQSHLAGLAAQARRLADALDRLAVEGRPTPSDMVDAPVLTDWYIGLNENPGLVGRLVGDPIGAEWTTKTDDLFAVDYDGKWARTWSRWYALDAKAPSLRRGRP